MKWLVESKAATKISRLFSILKPQPPTAKFSSQSKRFLTPMLRAVTSFDNDRIFFIRNDPARGFKGRDDGESDTEGGEGRGWGGINLANPAEVPRRPTPGWFEKEGFVNLGRTFQPPVRNPAIEPLFKNPNTGMPQLSPSGVVMSVRKLVPFAVSELETQQKTSSYSYRDLFARRCTPAGCLAEGEIIKLLKWKMNKDKRFFTGNYAEKVGGIKKAANNFHEAYKLRRENDIYPDDPHLDMTFALKKAVGDLEDFTSKLMNEG